MNSVFQLILLSIFVAYQVQADKKLEELQVLAKDKKIADDFHSTVIEKLTGPLNCSGHVDGQDQFLNELCNIINQMEPKFHEIKGKIANRITELELNILFKDLSKMIIDDIPKFKKLIVKTMNEKEKEKLGTDMKKCIISLHQTIHGKAKGEIAKDKKEIEKEMAKHVDYLTKVNEALTEKEIKCLLDALNLNLTNLKITLKSKKNEGMLKEGNRKFLAAESIIQLENIIHYKSIKGNGHVDLTNAFSAFSVELMIYAMGIPAIHTHLDDIEKHIQFH